jgi:calcium-dependent protein kinase
MKVIDFGTAMPYDKTGKKILTEKLGTPYYIAPEVLAQKYNEKCDIWSIGVITYMLLSGRAPFSGDSDDQIFRAIKVGKFSLTTPTWKGVSDDAKNFVKHLLTYDHSKRPSAADALNHKWLQIEQSFDKT